MNHCSLQIIFTQADHWAILTSFWTTVCVFWIFCAILIIYVAIEYAEGMPENATIEWYMVRYHGNVQNN